VDVQAWDEVFIRCTRAAANALVVDVAGWAAWWPGLAATPLDDRRTEVVLHTPWRAPRRHRLVVTADRVRPRDKGLEMTVAGDVVGTAEWFHLDRGDGVVVNYLLRGRVADGGWRRLLAAHRASVRAALTDAKRRLEAGRLPGTEPEPALLAHQAAELVTFAEEVRRHEQELAEQARAARAAGADPA
jgi:hypothetical protein